MLERWFGLGWVSLISRGPLWQDGVSEIEMVQGLKRLTAGRMATLLNDEMTPPQILRRAGFVSLLTPQTLAEIDLTTSQADHRAALHGKWRNRLVKAELDGLWWRHVRVTPAPDHWLFAKSAAQQREKSYKAWPPALTCLFGETNPGAVHLFEARAKGVPIAAMMFLAHGTGLTYHIGWTSPAGRHANAHTLLLWKASCWARGQGFERLDLGFVDTDTAPGLARFKLGAGATARTLGGTWLHSRATAPFARIANALRRSKAPHPASFCPNTQIQG